MTKSMDDNCVFFSGQAAFKLITDDDTCISLSSSNVIART